MAKRRIIQILSAIAQNSYFKGFFTGSLYRGKLKNICVPGMNCYSCPGAVGSCPIGALQAVSQNPKLGISFYIYGVIMLIGIITGRFVCGFLCPFGLIQELLHKIPLKKFRENNLIGILGKLRYAVLVIIVIGIPTVLSLTGQISFPAFCQWICPVGTLEAGIPLSLTNPRIRSALGWMFVWKLTVLAGVIFLSIKIFRAFCRFLCPLGALYSLFNRISIIHIKTDGAACNNCGACVASCKMQAKNTDDPECIRCGECISKCPKAAMTWCIRKNPVKDSNNSREAKP